MATFTFESKIIGEPIQTIRCTEQSPDQPLRKSIAGALRAGATALNKQAEYGDTHPIEISIGGPIQAILFLIVSVSCTVWLFRNRLRPIRKQTEYKVLPMNPKAEITKYNKNQPK